MAKDGDLAIAGDNQGQVSLWNLIRGELIETIIDTNPGVLENENKQQQQNIGVCQVALFNSHLFSVIAFTDSTVSVYDNELGDVVTVFTEHQSQVKYLHILEESRKVFTSDGANSCKIWVAHSGQLLETITVACSLIGLSPDIKYVVSGPGENM
jgi:WD40 repeat protein